MIKAGFQPDSETLKNISFREIAADDTGFLCRLYGSTREAELAVVPWSQEQKVQFIQMQFDAQHLHYQEYFPNANFLIIQQSGSDIGRIYIDRRKKNIGLIDIALVSHKRNLGIGGALLAILIEEAQHSALPIQIHVEKYNPATGLYPRLGFTTVEEKGVYDLMEWQPSRHQANTAS